MKKNIVEIHNVSFARNNLIIFDALSICIPRGKIIAIIGPSGVGKTTLLRLIGGQLRPTNGEIWFNDVNIPTLSRASLYQVRKKMSMLFQVGALFTDLTVFDNVAWPLREHACLPTPLLHSTVIMKLEAVGLRGAAHLKPSELSGGMIRRTALARTLALEPDLIMFDEPFVGQDPVTVKILIKLIHELQYALDMTFIIVSHDIPEVLKMSDYIYIIDERRILAQGTTHDLYQHHNIRVRQFIDGILDGPIPIFFPTQDYLQELLSFRQGAY
ncbi:Intermembrane phospholipid transport system ATP-binding protein MlaF [Candidatus Erwinia haradaeae]|uniref:Intermembrane phospholipid transport system ATP-binding protein MlaF n=1 Tax=Candidatus Erwinia haradaeae TaxID=1922217 RepID=A0A451DCF9_9GAMM|nr:ATP-binding cassette domain-containing protein [Candidatus Erwinia haradaeae]VFP84124.1 Intermembrane phospholipid transport system ATP-binding protein MlaF [Candidatus Erwinia haradaeae]